MVKYIKSDLEFILEQIKLAEAHAAGQPLYGEGGLIPTYNLAWGLRTVDGTYNNLLHPTWGAADQQFPEPRGTEYRPATPTALGGPPGTPLTASSYAPMYDPAHTTQDPNFIVVDGSLRTISNLIVDQTLANPAAVLTALQRAGVDPSDQMTTAAAIANAYAPLKPLYEALGDAQRAYANASAAAAASPTNAPLQQAAANALVAVTAAETAIADAPGTPALAALLADNGVVMDGTNISLPAIAPDEGLSAPFNSWFTLFGQFFDHGLDLINKGGSGTVFIPLAPDDPLYVPGSPTNFMVLTRATVTPGLDGVMGTADDVRPVNTTTPFVDQNQTYTSHPSHQVFLRDYVLNAAGDPVSTGKLIEGGNGGMATWADVKAQAADLLGIQLVDSDVGDVPLLATDQYGEFIRGPNGYPQIVTATGLVEGDPAGNGGLGVLIPANAFGTGHAFLADIAHSAVPTGLADGDIEIGLGNPDNGPTAGQYDNELLDAHYIAGDGRANENIGLTAVHHVFHSEHNRLVQHTKDTVIADAAAMLAGGATQTQAIAFLNEWLIGDVAAVPVGAAAIAALVWDGERLFQAAKFGTEMQYQHLVFEEFARKIQPNINVFLVPDGYDVTIDPSILAEFAHVVYRFGHSMLTETIDRYDPTFTDDDIGLIEGFLNPLQFENNGGTTTVDADISAGAIIRGMTRQVGNDIDEFVTGALRNNLLGLPLDLATINLARGRDTGVPSLNSVRRDFYEATNGESLLKPYESWVDFAGHLKHEASIINFIAAYGTHALITTQTTIEGKRDAALTIITGVSVGGLLVPNDAEAFLNGTGVYAASLGGLENVDLWIGGLAEATMPFGGMLGSTFNFVFETQMEKLQNGDRFYYLQRLDGLHLFSEMEGNSFAALIMRNTDATHLPSDVFSTPGLILEVDRTKQFNPDLGETAGLDGVMDDDPLTAGNEAADNMGIDPTGGGILTPLVIRNNPATVGPDSNYLRYTGGDHVVLGGTEAADILIASIGDDTLFGDGGADRLEGGFGNDIINGGAGDDIIRDAGGDDNIKGGDGHDVVNAGNGLDLVLGGAGQDFVVLGTDMGSEVFGGEGNDFIYGNKNAERLLGNEGDDWLETGTFDGAPGDNFDEIFARDSIRGNDVFLGDGGFDEFIGEGGDDIFVGSPGRGKMAGMSGFDWATYKDNTAFVNADLSVGIVFDEAPTLPANSTLDEFESVQGLSGTAFNDVLKGSNEDALTMAPLAQGGSTGYLGSGLDAQGIALINGLQAVLGAGVTSFAAGDIILGGDGSDLITGQGGDDIIDGDKWLNVRISIRQFVVDTPGGMGAELYGANNLKSMTSAVTIGGVTKPLTAWMFEGAINPGQLTIVREILTDTTPGDTDTAVFRGLRSEYAFSATADGQVIVSHAIENQIDGTDRLRNIEKVQFLDGGPLNIVVGTPYNDNGLATQGPPPLNQPVLNGTAGEDLIIGLAGTDVLNGFAGNDILVGGPGSQSGTFSDTFSSQSYSQNNGTLNFGGNWTETNDGAGAGSPTAGDIEINGSRLRFDENIGGGEIITRSLNLTGATTATLSFSYEDAGLDAFTTGNPVENVHVEAWNGTSWDVLGTFGGNTPTGSNTFSVALTSAQIGSHSSIRFRAEGDWEGGENFYIDNFLVTVTNPALNGGADTLNGGLGDDTYSFGLGDGNDTINEAVNATSGGAADRISILAPSVGLDIDGLPIPTLTGLNANDSNGGTNNGDLVISYSLPTGAATSVTQTITVAGHFTGTNAQTGVERINFNGATYAGYLLGVDDYLISRLDPGNRDAGGVDLSASIANNFIVGETGTNDEIIGGAGNDLIFGGTGDNNLSGGLGDDLLVGGSGTGDNDVLDGGGDLDTMIGLAGNDTYVVDDVGDVVVEALGEGTDTVETLMAALSIELISNVENLTYTGADADQFVGTGNALANVITGGDLADTLSGLGGADTLQGGLGADAMLGGDGGDVYFVDDAGDVVTETNADLVIGGTDRVESDVDFTLGANVENLDLNGTAILGRGNALNNVINGNDEANQLFGGGGLDTLTGGDGNDLLDGGDGNDTLSGGNGNDTIIGGAGADAIDVGGGFNTIVYNAINFGADVINSFDAAGGTPTTQDRIDLSGLGITAANFAARVGIAAAGANTLITVRDAALVAIGTIQVNGVTSANIDVTDFTLATSPAAAPINGTAAANTLNGTANADTINGLGGADTLNGLAGADVLNGGEGADTLNGGDGNDTLSGGVGSDVGTFADDFATASYANSTGTVAFAGEWTESGGETTSATGGDILINGGRLQFAAGIDGGETIQRSINLTGATAATLAFNYEADDLDAGESVTVQAFNGTIWQTLGTLGGDSNGTLNFSAPLTAAHTAIRFVAVGNFENGENFYIDNVTVTHTVLGLNAGVDTVNGDAGDDTIVWNANASGATDGRDVVNGGIEGANGDVFTINGNATGETYRIYSRAEWDALPGDSGLVNADTEIVITRNGTAVGNIIAELREIEEIRLNGVDPSGASGPAGVGDTFQLIGDFSGTSLRLNTVTIGGSSGDDTIDISGLSSDHRIVFTSNGGADTVVGAVRAQDVVDDATYVAPPPPPPRVVTASDSTDLLVGSAAADTFVFPSTSSDGSNSKNRDIISNFVSGQDRIDLSGIDASRLGGLDQQDNDAFGSVQAGTSFAGVAEIRFHTETVKGVTYTVVEGNIDNDNTPEFEIALTGIHQLSVSDFIL